MAMQQVSQGYTDGVCLGQSATDKVGFFGKTARIQATAAVSIGTTRTTAIIIARINTINAALKNLGLTA